MKRFGIASILTLGLIMGGCGGGYVAPVVPPQGLLFTSVSAPIDTDAEETPMTSRVGESSSLALFGLFAFGDASVTAAAQDGNLSEVNHVDYQYLNILYIYQNFTVRAFGE